MKSIKILGVTSGSYLQLKENLILGLQRLGIDLEIEEVNHIDEILKYSVSSVPAIVIGTKVRLAKNGHIPSIEEIVEILQHSLI